MGYSEMDYDKIGTTYTATRQADPRIAQQLIEQLDLPAKSRLVDIGAGTGNYSQFLAKQGFVVTAVEPSLVMRRQGQQHRNLEWVDSAGEQLPQPDHSFDGGIMTLSLHHFADWALCIAEALRVCGGGPLVIFAFNPQHTPDFWLYDYFPSLAVLDAGFKPSFDELQTYVQSQGWDFSLTKFPLPIDLIDCFAAAGWGQPDIYTDEKFQDGISTFSKLSEKEKNEGREMLERDLESGQWSEKYGGLKLQQFHDRGYGFIRIQIP